MVVSTIVLPEDSRKLVRVVELSSPLFIRTLARREFALSIFKSAFRDLRRGFTEFFIDVQIGAIGSMSVNKNRFGERP